MISETDKPLVNRVANSGLVTLDLEKFYPEGDIVPFDLKDFLFMGMILKEKDFREALATLDWSQYQSKHLAVFCSADAIIPMWAYMLVASGAATAASDVIQCTPGAYAELYLLKHLAALPIQDFSDKRVVIKGCSNRPVSPSAYLEITRRLQPVVRSIMFGEPCSTVPVFKKSMNLQVES